MISFRGQLCAFVILCYVLLFLADVSTGLQCKQSSLFSPGLYCPEEYDSDKKFCCEKDNGRMYCCDFDDFAKMKGEEYIIPVASGIVIGILAVCFICCLCCPCCMLYKRRHRGTVYGRVQQPTAIVTVQHGPAPPIVSAPGNMPVPNTMPMPMPMPMPQPGTGPVLPQVAPYPTYQAPTGDFSGQQHMPPPPYSAVTNEGYAKQAPYNPNFYNN